MADVIIIGGGASGMTAAIQAAQLGVSVCILEKKDRVGRKLLTTGNGRCNLSNRDLDFSHYHGSIAKLLPKLWKRMDADRVEEFWRELGIDYVEGENGKVYPRSLQAGSVVNALRRKIEELGIEVRTETPVKEIRRIHQGYLVMTDKETIQTKVVILCAGGKAYPKLGADGEGARLAKNLKMQVNPLRPALCRLNLDFPFLKRLSGVKLTIPISLYWDGECQQTQQGEVLFTDTGLSGPPVLNLSRMVGEGLSQKKQMEVVLDLVPEMESGQLFSYMLDRMKRLSSWTLEEALEGWLPKKMVPVILLLAEVDRLQEAGSLHKRQIGAVCRVLKAFSASVSGLAGWEEAQITVGGIAEREVTERLESRKHKGLFLAGEVLDLDGDCGGYNLQWAVGSALIAAEEAARFVQVNYD
ncbi:MAG: NAD(P)/FAD-dependent oxidoreductase [Firmicutes bacterium]|nr:NAD(P)/FAD-dependent oxidoreductase [Bacillota bacterium]